MLSVSAVIPTRNRHADLMRCVKSVVRQKRMPDRLIVIDQSEDDISKKEIETLMADLALGTEVVYVLDNSKKGLIEAKKASISHANTDLVMFLEDDVILTNDYIENLAKGFEVNPEMMGSCGVVRVAPAGSRLYRMFFSFFHTGIFSDPRVMHFDEFSSGKMFSSVYLSGGLSAFRKEVFDAVPYDRVNNFAMLEDIDFSVRAADVFGEDRFFINSSAKLDHLLSPVNREVMFPKHQRKAREFVCFYKKHRQKPWALLSLFWLANGLLVESLLKSVKSLRITPLTGTLSGLFNGIKWQIKPYD